MRVPKIGVVVVAQNDAETIERSVGSYYQHVEAILLSTDPSRGWTGAPITSDGTVDLVRALDREGKLTVAAGDHYKTPDPSLNDTLQRQDAVDRLAKLRPDLDWILQIDADEVFFHFPNLIERLAALPSRTRAVAWWWVSAFQRTEDGRLLVVTDYEGRPMPEYFPTGHRPPAKLESCRAIHHRVKSPFLRKVLKLDYVPPLDRNAFGPYQAVLHLSFAKSERRIREKLSTYTHSNQIDRNRLLETWLAAPTEWESIRDFHPLTPTRWPALRPFSEAELAAYDGPFGRPYRG